MEWSWYDPVRGEETRWWTIDPSSGQPDGNPAPDPIARHCLGESVLDDVGLAGDAIATTFATRLFSDDDVSALLMKRMVPPSFQGGKEDAAELLGLVDGLWSSAEDYYQQALGRRLTGVERRWLCAFAFGALRARQSPR